MRPLVDRWINRPVRRCFSVGSASRGARRNGPGGARAAALARSSAGRSAAVAAAGRPARDVPVPRARGGGRAGEPEFGDCVHPTQAPGPEAEPGRRARSGAWERARARGPTPALTRSGSSPRHESAAVKRRKVGPDSRASTRRGYRGTRLRVHRAGAFPRAVLARARRAHPRGGDPPHELSHGRVRGAPRPRPAVARPAGRYHDIRPGEDRESRYDRKAAQARDGNRSRSRQWAPRHSKRPEDQRRWRRGSATIPPGRAIDGELVCRMVESDARDRYCGMGA